MKIRILPDGTRVVVPIDTPADCVVPESATPYAVGVPPDTAPLGSDRLPPVAPAPRYVPPAPVEPAGMPPLPPDVAANDPWLPGGPPMPTPAQPAPRQPSNPAPAEPDDPWLPGGPGAPAGLPPALTVPQPPTPAQPAPAQPTPVPAAAGVSPDDPWLPGGPVAVAPPPPVGVPAQPAQPSPPTPSIPEPAPLVPALPTPPAALPSDPGLPAGVGPADPWTMPAQPATTTPEGQPPLVPPPPTVAAPTEEEMVPSSEGGGMNFPTTSNVSAEQHARKLLATPGDRRVTAYPRDVLARAPAEKALERGHRPVVVLFYDDASRTSDLQAAEFLPLLATYADRVDIVPVDVTAASTWSEAERTLVLRYYMSVVPTTVVLGPERRPVLLKFQRISSATLESALERSVPR